MSSSGSYVTSDGRVVAKKPFSWNPLVLLPALFWGIVNFFFFFFRSCFPATKTTSASGGVTKGRPPAWKRSTDDAPPPRGPPSANIRGVGDFKPDPCGGGS
jgi:hypothetical protein